MPYYLFSSSIFAVGTQLQLVIEVFHWIKLPGRIMALESTQPLRETNITDIFWGLKAAVAEGWHPYHLRVPLF